MNIEKLTEERILEQYLIGSLSQKEKEEVEILMSKNNDIKKEYQQLEQILYNVTKDHQINPPKNIEKSIFETIKPKTSTKKEETSSISVKKLGVFSVAASLFLIVFLSFLYFKNSNQNLITELQISNEKLSEKLLLQEKQLTDANSYNSFLVDNLTKQLVINTKNNKTFKAYFNNSKKKVLVNASDLEPLMETECYQLWADVEGEMINMGVLDNLLNNLSEVKFIENTESLNITIEPKGGSQHPTVENLIGSVKI